MKWMAAASLSALGALSSIVIYWTRTSRNHETAKLRNCETTKLPFLASQRDPF
jgi:hypothetical protein